MSLSDPPEGADVADVRVEVFLVGDEAEAAATLDISVAGGADRGGVLVLPPGIYRVDASPLDLNGDPSVACQPDSQMATVVAGGTTTVNLVLDCAAIDNGGLDIGVDFNHGPTIVELRRNPGTVCAGSGIMDLEVVATDPEGDALSYSWVLVDGAGDPPPNLDGTDNVATFAAAQPGLSEAEVSVSDGGSAATLRFTLEARDCTQPEPEPEPEALQIAEAQELDVRFSQLIYSDGEQVAASVRVGSYGSLPGPAKLAFVSSDSGDVEVVDLVASAEAGRFDTSGVVTSAAAAGSAPSEGDGLLQMREGEMIFAIFHIDPNGPAAVEGDMAFDFALMEDSSAAARAPIQIVPELDLRTEPSPKPGGIVVREQTLPVEIPHDELIYQPRSQDELSRFLAEAGAEVIVSDDVIDPAADPNALPLYLLDIDRSRAITQHASQLRDLLGEHDNMLVDSQETLEILTLAMQYKLDGYLVGVNPRLYPAAAPTTREDASLAGGRTMEHHPGLSAPDAWAHTALWEGDEAANRVNMSFLDMGFDANDDFRLAANGQMRQCDMEASGASFVCQNRVGSTRGNAESPPTVGASLVGGRVWHGNGVVTTAVGVINNNYGAAGVGGQVGVPMLYRYGIGSYAFEIGLGIEQSVRDGASVVNASVGYPCRAVSSILLQSNICRPGGRAAFCAAVSLKLAAATLVVCAATSWIPIAGAIACGAATIAVSAATVMCFTTLIFGDLQGRMERGVSFATARGVPVVTVAGNNIQASLPNWLNTFINLSERRTDRWGIIPAMIPDTIVAGAVNVGDMSNAHFFGTRVDIWAPIRSAFFAPSSTNALAPSASHVEGGIGGTSAAAPYVSGAIALMQALNPDLDPARTARNATDRRNIPVEVKAFLRNTAHLDADLVAMGFPTDSERTRVIDTIAAVRAATPASVRSFGTRGYDTALNFDETNAATSHDTAATAKAIASGTTETGTILVIPGTNGAPTFRDRDFYRMSFGGAGGVFKGVVELTLPAPNTHGQLFVAGADLRRTSVSQVSADEVRLRYETPERFGANTVDFRVHGFTGNDNVYKLVTSEVQTAAVNPDRFDADDPVLTPPESRPDNDVNARAAQLGKPGTFAWTLTQSSGAGPVFSETHRVSLSNPLNFHDAGDVDWFEVATIPTAQNGSIICDNRLSVQITPTAPVTVTENGGATTKIPTTGAGERLSPFAGERFSVEAQDPQRYGEYTLVLHYEVRTANALADCTVSTAPLPGGIPLLPGSGIIKTPDIGDRPILPEELDELGRWKFPEPHPVEWGGGPGFRAVFDLLEGDSLKVRLLDADGGELASAARSAVGAEADMDLTPGGDTMLELDVAGDLPAGIYTLEVSEVFPETQVDVVLPRGAVHDGSAAVEDYETPLDPQ